MDTLFPDPKDFTLRLVNCLYHPVFSTVALFYWDWVFLQLFIWVKNKHC